MTQEQARKAIAEWFVELWIDRPAWLAAMPSQKEIDKLIEKLVNA